eukprot:5230771-Pleurochrysis_carterae.AAC.2
MNSRLASLPAHVGARARAEYMRARHLALRVVVEPASNQRVVHRAAFLLEVEARRLRGEERRLHARLEIVAASARIRHTQLHAVLPLLEGARAQLRRRCAHDARRLHHRSIGVCWRLASVLWLHKAVAKGTYLRIGAHRAIDALFNSLRCALWLHSMRRHKVINAVGARHHGTAITGRGIAPADISAWRRTSVSIFQHVGDKDPETKVAACTAPAARVLTLVKAL